MSSNKVVGRGTAAVAPLDFIDGAARIGLFQGRIDLRLGELPLAYGNLSAKVDYSFFRKVIFRICHRLGGAYATASTITGA
jgi:hypothetical protein